MKNLIYLVFFLSSLAFLLAVLIYSIRKAFDYADSVVENGNFENKRLFSLSVAFPVYLAILTVLFVLSRWI